MGNALSIIEREGKIRGLETEPMIERCKHGFREYGSDNHLKPEFDVWKETIEELWDGFNIACFAIDAGASPLSVDDTLNKIADAIKSVQEQMA